MTQENEYAKSPTPRERAMGQLRDDVSGLDALGSGSSPADYHGNPTAAILETFPNTKPERDYWITHQFDEFTSLCPKTGQPDFAEIEIGYVADKVCVETKSLKLYFFSFRNEGAFMETLANRIFDDLHAVLSPRTLNVRIQFNPRGGISTSAFCSTTQKMKPAGN